MLETVTTGLGRLLQEKFPRNAALNSFVLKDILRMSENSTIDVIVDRLTDTFKLDYRSAGLSPSETVALFKRAIIGTVCLDDPVTKESRHRWGDVLNQYAVISPVAKDTPFQVLPL